MKKTFLRLVSLLLLLAMLLPLAVACKKDPPPNNDDDDDTQNGGNQTPVQYYIEAALSGYDTMPICDFSSQEFIGLNANISQRITGIDGKTAYRWEPSVQGGIAFNVPQSSQTIDNKYYFEICLYSEFPTNHSVTVTFEGAGSKALPIDFSGWRTFHIQTDNITVKNPYPSIKVITFNASSDTLDTVYIGNLTAINPKYSLSVPEGVDINDPSLYKGIIDTFRECLVGPATPMDNDAYRQKALNSQNNGKNSWKLFKNTSDSLTTPETLFDIKVFNIPYNGYGTPKINGGRVSEFYANVYCMAQGYGVPGTELYKNPELLTDILTALEYGYQFYYGKDIVETGVTHGNWWEWDIGIPMYLIESLTIIFDDVDKALVSKYLAPFDKIVALPPGSACNLVDMSLWVIVSSALKSDGYRLCAAKELMNETFQYLDEPTEIVKPGDGGFYTDGSYIQHSGTPYAGAYGASLLNAISSVVFLLKDSRFAYHGEYLARQCEWVLNAYRPFIYEKNFMSFLCGRGVSRSQSEQSNLVNIIASTIKISYYAPDEYKNELRALVKYVMQKTGVDFTPKVQYPLISYCYELINDTSVPALAPLEEAMVFGAMDRIVQHRPDYAIGIALSSTRIYKYEAINGENQVGWYHGDGMVYIYTDGYDYSNTFYWYADPYLMPGTTVSNGRRTVTCIYPAIFNTSPYAGGVEHGKYGASGFILGYPSNAPAFEDSAAKNIRARKSYFMFDNEVVCLGNGIFDNTGSGARTVVENRLWRDGDVLSVNGSAVTAPSTTETEIDARTMHFTNMGGYVFLESNKTVLYSKATSPYNNARKDTELSDTRDFLEISLSHGSGNVTNGKYAYVYLPEATVQETEDYNDIQILLLGDTTHAVLEKKLGIVGCVFFEDFGDGVTLTDCEDYTAVSGIEADTPCILMVSKGENGEYNISVSDPTQTYSNIKFYITIDGISEVVSADTGVSSSISGNTISVTVNCKGALGSTFNLTVK